MIAVVDDAAGTENLLSRRNWFSSDTQEVTADSWSIVSVDRLVRPAVLSQPEITVKVERDKPKWLDAAIQHLTRLLALPPNWDSHEGHPVEIVSTVKTIRVLVEVMRAETPIPAFVPTSAGGIQLEWHRAGIDLELEITPSGRVNVSYDDQWTNTEWEGDVTTNVGTLKGFIPNLSRPSRT